MARLAGATYRTLSHEVFAMNGLCFDEAALKIGMNDARCLDGRVTTVKRPGADLLLIEREKCSQSKHTVRTLNERH